MLKRCLSPLTLVNQVALIVLLSTAIGLAGMAVSGWLVQGVQGSAHAINKAGSLRMQSYRLLAAVPLSEKDKPLIKEMEQTAFSAELTRAAERDGQLAQLQGLQDYWRNELIPALMRAQNRETVSADVSQFVAGLDQLVSGFDRTTEMRIETVVLVHRVMAVFMALLLVFTIIWLRARLLQPWRQLLAMASAVSHRDFTQRANISGRNEMAMLGTALNNMSAELAESYAVLEQRVQEKTAGLEHKNQILSFLWQANRRLHSRAPLCERLSPVLNGLQNLTLLRDIELRVYDTDDEENHQEFTCQPDMTCDDKGCQLCPRGILPVGDRGTTLKWRLADSHTQYGILLATLPQGRHLSHDQQVALISAAMYGVFLLIQTKTHQSLFVYEHEDDSDDDDPHHGKPSAHSSLWHAIWLIVHLIAVIAVTKMNASPLETLLDSMNAPVAFTGFLVALLILSPEGLGALKAVLNNQVQRAMNLFFGSVLATISLTVPVVTLIAFMTGNELQFALGAPEMVVMVASLVLCHISFSTGRTNVLNGAAHLALFAAYLMTIFA